MTTTIFDYTPDAGTYQEGPEWLTNFSRAEGGREVRRKRWSSWRFRVYRSTFRFEGSTNDVGDFLDDLATFYGAYDTFLYKPKLEWFHQVTTEAVGTGTGSATSFALDSKYIDSTTLLVYIDDVLQSSGYSLTGNNTAPTIVFSSPPGLGEVITASYERYFPCRLDGDRVPLQLKSLSSAGDDSSIWDLSLTFAQDYPGSHLV